MRAVFVFGTRPEVTKGAGIAAALAAVGDIDVVGVATGQQTELVEKALEDASCPGTMSIVWAGDKNAPRSDAAWREKLGPALTKLCSDQNPSILVGVGDTHSVVEAAEVGKREHLAFVHLEAGIRHSAAPEDWEPEERNRREISKLALVHCCPTARQRSNLLEEGVDGSRIHVLGDLSTVSVAETWRRRRHRLGLGQFQDEMPVSRLSRRLCLCTFHRSTSVSAMDKLLQSFCECVGMFPDVQFVICERPDSRWKRFIEHARKAENVTVSPAPPPLEFQALLCRSDIVVTDSAGVQQEALILNRPVVALRANLELRADSPLLIQVRPPFLGLSPAVWAALRSARTPRELDLWLHCQSSDAIVARGAGVIRLCAQESSNLPACSEQAR